KNTFEGAHVVAAINQVSEGSYGRRHLIDRKGEARQHRGRQQRDQQGVLAGAELALGRNRDDVADAEDYDQEQDCSEKERPQSAAEGHPKPADREDYAERGVDQSDNQVGNQLSYHYLQRGYRSGDQLLHGATFPLARDGKR